MATVRPFRGVTFDPGRAPDLADVTCPPYDVISDAERRALYDRHPYNIVRIVSGASEPSDTPEDNRYTRAAGFFSSWLWEGVLAEDPDPALFVYRQTFSDAQGGERTVWGMVATISLDDEILAHERTMSGPKEDRLALMEAVPANISPIYALYREPDGGISRRLPGLAGGEAVGDFVDDAGTRHAAWAVHDPSFHDDVASRLADCPLLIADGHHRFETSKLYRDRRRAAGGEGPWDHTMCLLVDAGAEPVCILPYHRIVRTPLPDGALGALEAGYTIEDAGPAADLDAGAWQHRLAAPDTPPGTSLLVTPSRAYELHADAPGEIPAGVLERLALRPLGLRDAEASLRFTPRAEEVRDEVVSGAAGAGFLIAGVDVRTVWDHAASKAPMPEKSTYFHPKPRDGIVLRRLEDG